VPESSVVVRVAVVHDDIVLQAAQSLTYLFLDQLPEQQPPESYPEEWWAYHDDGPYEADYEVDPEVVSLTEWLDNVPDIFTSIPVLSLSLPPESLSGETGTHENPEERGVDWRRGPNPLSITAPGSGEG
jgi:hypothetical protein